MRLGSPLQAVHSALAQALYKDLPDITYENRDWAAWHKLDKQAQADAIRTRTEPRVTLTRRPLEHDVEVIMFPQTWGSTALGYGGMGGAAVTSAYTVVVHDLDVYCVYFGEGECAYKIRYSELTPDGREQLRIDISNHNMCERARVRSRYPLAAQIS
jgi:hypothetical protein